MVSYHYCYQLNLGQPHTCNEFGRRLDRFFLVCLIDGKVDQESEFEAELYDKLFAQLMEMKAGLRLG